MSKQIWVKSVKQGEILLKKMYDEAQEYLENIGFVKTPLLSVTDADLSLRSYFFTQAGEKIILEYKRDMFEEILKLTFNPLDIKFVYDILLMRFNQLASDEKERNIFIYNE